MINRRLRHLTQATHTATIRADAMTKLVTVLLAVQISAAPYLTAHPRQVQPQALRPSLKLQLNSSGSLSLPDGRIVTLPELPALLANLTNTPQAAVAVYVSTNTVPSPALLHALYAIQEQGLTAYLAPSPLP